MFAPVLDNLKQNTPLVHNITNYVTVNDCANILLACGASPIMADDVQEVEDIIGICGGLNINIGTLNQQTIPSMYLAGVKANKLDKPVLLDPVGAGASALRTKTALHLMEAISFSVIRGNISEIKTLAAGTGTTHGVDADAADYVNEDNLQSMIAFAKHFAKQSNTILAITGAIDIVTDGKTAYVIRNGHPLMGRITGTGCMLSALTTAFVIANPYQTLEAVATAVCAMGLCGELAVQRMNALDGTASFRTYLIDAMSQLDTAALQDGAKYEIY